MSYGKKGAVEPVLDLVSSYGPWSPMWGSGNYPGVTGGFEAANRTIYQPIFIPVTSGSRVTARRVWWANGGTVNATSNITVGIYSDTGKGKPYKKIVACTPTAQGTANELQFADITDTDLNPGPHWLAIALSQVTTTNIAAGGGSDVARVNRFQEASNFPATATPVNGSSSNSLYVFGFSTVASP